VAFIAAIESALTAQFGQRWQRLTDPELLSQPLSNLAYGWRIDVDPAAVKCPSVDCFVLLADRAFPLSQLRVAAPPLGPCEWPHVEAQRGLLCLQTTRLDADPGQRALQHLRWAFELLNQSEDVRRREFEREFVSYWIRAETQIKSVSSIQSLITPDALSRGVAAYVDLQKKIVVGADDRVSLKAWLNHAGYNPSDKQITPSWLIWLDRPWLPTDFPDVGRDILNKIPPDVVPRILTPGRICPIFIGADTISGSALLAVLLRGAPEKELTKGFRNISRVPPERIEGSFSAYPVARYRVTRVDGPWVHGRDQDPSFPYMSRRRVAVVGCGAIGAELAYLLAQSGVGHLTLIDNDVIHSANISRHLLGQPFIGRNKAQSTAAKLMGDFPHMKDVQALPKKFSDLTASDRERVAVCDVIVSAGVDYEGDMQIDSWRRGLKRPPVHVCVWAEPFSIAGHATALFGKDSLTAAFDDEERVTFRLTDWPAESNVVIVEAGCGNMFQPHGRIDLQPIIGIGAKMALDVLVGDVFGSMRRVWQGRRSDVAKRGGTVLETFGEDYCIKDYEWR